MCSSWKLYFSLLTLVVLPTIYITIRLFLINDFPSEHGVNITSQVQWLALIYEIAQEEMILPLFYLLGKAVGHVELFQKRISTILLITFIF